MEIKHMYHNHDKKNFIVFFINNYSCVDSLWKNFNRRDTYKKQDKYAKFYH